MTIAVTVELGYEFDVKAPAKEVFDVLSNVSESASHYPQVEKLTEQYINNLIARFGGEI